MRSRLLLPALLAATLLGACSVVGGEAAPEPRYTTVQSVEPFEVRDYPALHVVRTTMADGSRDGFGRLFDYISGANTQSDKIAMTAPVLQTEGEKIAMTAPVLQTTGSETRDMIFVLPDPLTAETAPVPTDPTVSLDTIPPRRVAVITFSGRLEDEAVAEKRAELEAWMAAQGLTPIGPAESAGYNPPWTIPALRRNEVLIPIDPATGG
ncbi:MAG: heme-binding protein [Pseudomonadota bacterium]